MIKVILTRTSKIFLFWFVLATIIILSWLNSYNPNDQAVVWATITCGAMTIWFWYYGRRTVECLACYYLPNWLKMLILGLSGALVIETVFWFWEKFTGATGVAAHPNFLLDLLLTMPWYALMVLIFWQVQKRYRYTTAEILLFGGIYELGADGLIGGLYKGNPWLGIAYGLIGLPIFITVYSVMMLPLSMLLKKIRPLTARPITKQNKKVRRSLALLPLLGLVPFLIFYLIIAK